MPRTAAISFLETSGDAERTSRILRVVGFWKCRYAFFSRFHRPRLSVVEISVNGLYSFRVRGAGLLL
jgi:hypothetical protein